jgi:pimeloyl-ACP methyl ester carboxylesterase
MFARTGLVAASFLLITSGLARAQAAGNRVSIHGMRMYYEVSGAGDPLIVLHGAYMNIPSMGAIIPALARTRKVYALEFQGHGRTTDIDRPITYTALADDVAAFMDSVRLAKADVIGYSMGAIAGLQLAIRHPTKVNKLVVASGAYDLKGWQPEYTAFIPQMTVEMIVQMPFAAEYKKLAPNPNGLSRAGPEAHSPGEGTDGVGSRGQGPEDAGPHHCRGRRRGHPRAFGGDVPPARRRRHGRHGKAPPRPPGSRCCRRRRTPRSSPRPTFSSR